MKKTALVLLILLALVSSAGAYPGQKCNFDVECSDVRETCEGSMIYGKVCVHR